MGENSEIEIYREKINLFGGEKHHSIILEMFEGDSTSCLVAMIYGM
jgi:hypothetical protein